MSNMQLARDLRGEAVQVLSTRANGLEGATSGGTHVITSSASSQPVVFTEAGAGNPSRVITIHAVASIWARFSNGVAAASVPAVPSSNGDNFLIPAGVLVDLRVPAGADRINLIQDVAPGRVTVIERR